MLVEGSEREGKPPSLSPQHSSEGRNILSHNCRRDRELERERERDGWMVDGKASWAAGQGNEGIDRVAELESQRERDLIFNQPHFHNFQSTLGSH